MTCNISENKLNISLKKDFEFLKPKIHVSNTFSYLQVQVAKHLFQTVKIISNKLIFSESLELC